MWDWFACKPEERQWPTSGGEGFDRTERGCECEFSSLFNNHFAHCFSRPARDPFPLGCIAATTHTTRLISLVYLLCFLFLHLPLSQ